MKLAIFTTSPDEWFRGDFPTLKANLEQAKGMTVETIAVRHVVFDKVPLREDSDGDLKPTWEWFKENFTKNAPGYDAVGFHFSRDEREKWGIEESINGCYNADHDDIFEFWVCCDEGQKAKRYDMSEWLRLVIHELGGHGFERFTYGYESQLTHLYDYTLRQLPALTSIMDFTEWNQKHAEYVSTAQRLISLLKRIVEKLTNPIINWPMYPLSPEYWTNVTQPFRVPNSRYKSGIHNGTDFACPIGTPVYAPEDGTIIHRGGDHPSLGGYVYFTCLFGDTRYWMRFLHLSRAMPIGSYKQGEIVGYTGNSGDVEGVNGGYHLHLDVWKCPIDSTLIYTPEGVHAYLLDPETFFKEKVDGLN